MKYRALWSAAALGVALHLAGLGWDAYMHARDSSLAAREGIFTLSNPSHALIIGGLALTTASLLGMGFAWAQERRLGGTGWLAVGARATALPSVAVAAAGAIWLASLAEDNSGHEHGVAEHVDTAEHVHAEDQPNPDEVAASDIHAHPATGDEAGMSEGSAHFHGTEIAVTPEQLEAASAFYLNVKASTAKWEDVSRAMADGYVQITPDLPGIAAHFVNFEYNSDRDLMNPEHPEILLYSKRMDGTWRLVGAMFSSEVASDEPPSFFGPLDVWHRHENLCFTAGAQVSVKNSAAECVNGLFVKTGAWNLHVWTAPGASGVFAHDFAPIDPGAFPAATRPAAQDLVANR